MSHYLAVSLRRSRNFSSLLISSQRYQRQFLSTSTKAIAVSTPEEIVDECSRLRASLQSLNDRFKGPLEKSNQQNTILPFVFLLGNHSSGKSSFVNYICQRKVQTAGVAPTDDAFTIIVPGPSDVDRDGPTFVGDPDMGFASLRTFGPNLVHHTRLKIRSNLAFKNFMLVDTPGMIDSPMVRDQFGNTKHAVMDRGYDFESVVRWYAERADVILLFFDPDKPGTTGETLSILTNSLVGLDHKLHIILNKADQFKKIHDFARAYGSLCWNLSKVIQRKDLPRIYTMCLPKQYHIPTGSDSDDQGKGIADLEETREDVVKEVLNAPKRRVDNEITRLTDAVSLLHMHLTIMDDLVKQYRKATFKSKMFTAFSALSSISAAAGSVALTFPVEISGAIAAAGLATTGGLFYYQNKVVVEKASELMREEAMVSSFKKLYARRIADKDEFITSLWTRVEDHLLLTLSPLDLRTVEKVKTTDIKDLEKILEIDIPNLRRKASPAFNKKL